MHVPGENAGRLVQAWVVQCAGCPRRRTIEAKDRAAAQQILRCYGWRRDARGGWTCPSCAQPPHPGWKKERSP